MHDIAMNSFDRKMLAALQDDGRLTNNELAERVGLSPSQCSRRRSALEAEGVVTGYHAELSRTALGIDVAAYVHVTLAAHSPDNARRFAELVNGLEVVQDACAITGEADYLLRVVAPDLRALARILNEVLMAHDSVAHVRSSIVLDELKRTTRLPV